MKLYRGKPGGIAIASLALAAVSAAQALPGVPPLPVHWEELTAPLFVQAVERAGGVAIIPMGILEKHGPHLPLGSDIMQARAVALRAAEQEYAVVFPTYYFGQIFEARHQPGTVAYSAPLIWSVLEETVAELARNGFAKIILVSGHGGNEHFVRYFCQAQLASPREYAVLLFAPEADPEDDPEVKPLLRTGLDWHAGERETSTMLAIAPGLVHLEDAGAESGADQGRLAGLPNAYTGIWWYARFPNHYAGDGGAASAELGEVLLRKRAALLAAMIRDVKRDTATLALQRAFSAAAARPVPPRP